MGEAEQVGKLGERPDGDVEMPTEFPDAALGGAFYDVRGDWR